MEFPLTAPAYGSNIPGIGGDDEINMYIETATESALVTRILIPTPALRVECVETSSGACRGMYRAASGRVFQVAGATLYELLENGTRTARGNIGTASGPIGMSDNGNHLILLDGGAGYTFDFVANTLTEITDAEFPNGANQVAFIDGYFLTYEPGSLFIRWSELLDGTAWPLLNRTSAYASPDEVASVIANGRELWAFGPLSGQVFYSTGEADQQFAPVQSVALDVGTDAPHSIAVARDSVIFVGAGKDGHGRVFRSNGYTVAPISTRGIEGILSDAGDLSGSVAHVHSFNGHTFYVLTVAAAEKTVVYDVDLGEWHERAWMNPDTGELKRWRGTYGCFAFGKMLMGDSNGNAVYRLSSDHWKDQKPDASGEWNIKRRRTMPHLVSGGKMVQHADFELWGRMGEGLVQGHGEDPVFILSWSNDGGREFYGVQHVKIGRLGNYDIRARFVMLGQARDRVYRIEMTDPVPFAWAGARGKVRVLDA
jgi:hypothetical protein